MRGCFFTGRHYVNIGTFIYIIPYGMIVDIGGRIYHLLFKVQTMDFSDIEVLRKETLITCTYLLEEERRNRLYLFLQGSDRLALMFIHCYEQDNHNGIVCVNESIQYEMLKSEINDKVDR